MERRIWALALLSILEHDREQRCTADGDFNGPNRGARDKSASRFIFRKCPEDACDRLHEQR